MDVGTHNRFPDYGRFLLEGSAFPLGLILGLPKDESPMSILRMANERKADLPVSDSIFPIVGQLFDWKAILKWDAYGPDKISEHRIFNKDEPTYTEQPLGFEVGVGVVPLEVNLGFDSVEFCDLLCTMCGWDMLHDNEPAASKPAGEARQPATRQTKSKAAGDGAKRAP